MDTALTVGKVAKRAGVNLQTVLYYERRGLLAPDRRTEAGYRLFSSDAARKIVFIKNAQGLGFTLNEIAGLLKLRIRSTASCGRIQKKAFGKLAIVQEKIEGLQSLERVLGNLIKACNRRRTTDACPVLEMLDDSKAVTRTSRRRKRA